MDIAGIVTLSELALADATKLKHIADQVGRLGLQSSKLLLMHRFHRFRTEAPG